MAVDDKGQPLGVLNQQEAESEDHILRTHPVFAVEEVVSRARRFANDDDQGEDSRTKKGKNKPTDALTNDSTAEGTTPSTTDTSSSTESLGTLHLSYVLAFDTHARAISGWLANEGFVLTAIHTHTPFPAEFQEIWTFKRAEKVP